MDAMFCVWMNLHCVQTCKFVQTRVLADWQWGLDVVTHSTYGVTHSTDYSGPLKRGFVFSSYNFKLWAPEN
jgi:hypothetical protein